MIWFTSDLHFGHDRVIEFCARPFASVPDMDGELIRRWNACVKPEDTIYVLGDFSFHNYQDTIPIVASLNGKKILIRGNHDHFSYGQYDSMGFTVFEQGVIRYFSERILLSHFPYWIDFFGPPSPTEQPYNDFKDRRPIDLGKFLLCGHVHERWKTFKRMINVGVDVWKFSPVPLVAIESLIAQYKQKERDGLKW